MSRYKAYPVYKPAGQNSDISIPEPWILSKVKFIGSYLNGFPFKPTQWDDTGIPIIRIQNLSNQEAEINRTEFVAPEKYRVQRGDILISWSATLDVYVWHGENAWLNQHIFQVKVNESLILKNYFYWSAKWFMGALNETSHGSTMQHLTTDKFGGFDVPLPPIEEQQKIANFLDHETAKIDTLIAKQQELIKLLKEKRQAVISHAVTKGINPNAPMRDSGVEWLGEVPAHWTVLQIRHILNSMEQGKSPECENRPADVDADEWGVLKTSCVNQAKYHSGENKVLPNYIAPFVQYEVKSGDVLMSRASGSVDLIGSVAYVYETPPRILLSDKIFRLEIAETVSRIFFSYLMQSSYIRSLIKNSISGAEGMANNITKTSVLSFRFALPPANEQVEIELHLEGKVRQVDLLLEKTESTIGILQERRTALISAAVTGKIDVRDWQPPSESAIAA